ncbi:DEAD/DEAH box helicase [Geobacter sulfurreducens]|uniref:DEAD/DEAH box helicase n=1 Tax=Geobacter sulfurreducens TaxID=35554 RepID=UPI000DBB7A9D|nr:DEAD/DEAH box helicase [Geobacter sulfurreducens]BBA70902.1 hypothetical protein YM18_2384 [Geobacter sulfurreducens]
MQDLIFNKCKSISVLLSSGKDKEARNELILLLDHLRKHHVKYNEIINNIIRQTGLYPYMDDDDLIWQDQLLLELFTQDVGGNKNVVLHREQSKVLSQLLSGDNLAISAPTSFGKSFIIDAFIKTKNPDNVVIIVPTIALTDETRRRLCKKFSRDYNIITTPDAALADRNILIFPQERALLYLEKLNEIDLLVIDEFYKASPNFDKERAHVLIKAILTLGRKAKQRYYLAPNIKTLPENPLTEGMKFMEIDFNTVYTKIHNRYVPRMSDAEKYDIIQDVLLPDHSKTLIYAGTYRNIGIISDFIIQNVRPKRNQLLNSFSSWIKENYSEDYMLSELVKRETGIHNGQLHRSLSQLQIKLFEEEAGLRNIISTSSIIEGVNTSAENVIIWSNKNGKPIINNFTYKNIVGRGGRMFKHFVGNVYLLDAMPSDESTQLDLFVDDSELFNLTEEALSEQPESLKSSKIDEYRDEMREIVGDNSYDRLLQEGQLLQSDSNLVKKIAIDIRRSPNSWQSLKMLNSPDSSTWDRAIYSALPYCGSMNTKHSVFVEFVKIIANNWQEGLPNIIKEVKHIDLNVNSYFDLEKNATYKLSTSLATINSLIKSMYPQMGIDVSPFISKLSSAFLPTVVYHLEEYGLPRSLAKKIQRAGIYNFEDDNLTIRAALDSLIAIGGDNLKQRIPGLHEFEHYIIDFFFDGILDT